MGVGIGGLEMWEKYHEILLNQGPRRITPFLIPGMISNLVPGQIAIRFNLKGRILSLRVLVLVALMQLERRSE